MRVSDFSSSAHLRSAAVAVGLIILSATSVAQDDRAADLDKKIPEIDKILNLKGEYVHNVGELQMNVTNMGFFGSLPNSQHPMSESPSAQWPAGSGVEYLYAAGLWVGALAGGVPSVSTAYPETEFYPRKGEVYRIYRSGEGDLRGRHLPDDPDDDGDGIYDEDWLNGIDDDRDGLIDEDFAAFGAQMFSCTFNDYQITASQVWPEHNPMYIDVRQETYQWAEEDDNEYIAVSYKIYNVGFEFLTDVYLGIYADLDAGPRNRGNYHRDDQIGYFEGIRCAKFGEDKIPIRIRVAYVYDEDGDDGITPGYFGISMIHVPTYISDLKTGILAQLPAAGSVPTHSFRVFSSLLPWGSGGEPTNDHERYEALSVPARDENTTYKNDYRVLLSVGPFYLWPSGLWPQELVYVYVCGDGLEDMLQNAANAAARFRGCWVDLDNDPTTGILGRETPMPGPQDDWYPDPCFYPDLIVDIPAGEVYWSNLDCGREIWEFRYRDCGHPPSSNQKHFQTGVDGKEHQVFWVYQTAPPPPNMRVEPGSKYVTIFWDDLSEVTPDPYSLVNDFEGYQIWRADNWHRPLGTSLKTGPDTDLWRILDTRDIINGVNPNREFRMPVSEGGLIYTPMEHLKDRYQYVRMFEEQVRYAPRDTVPCPPGLTREECDTLEAVARYNLGFEGGRRYYRYIDTKVKNGMPYFYSVTAYDHTVIGGKAYSVGRSTTPTSNFAYVEPLSEAQEAEGFNEDEIYVVPNPVTSETMEPWELGPNNADPSGLKCEFRNLPRCLSTVRIFTVSGDLVQTLQHDGSGGNGTLKWDLITRNGQDVVSGVYIFAVEPHDGKFKDAVGKFVVIR